MARRPLNVATICTGNIFRSPMAEVILMYLIDPDPAPKGHVVVTSAGTVRRHVRIPIDQRPRSALDRAVERGEQHAQHQRSENEVQLSF